MFLEGASRPRPFFSLSTHGSGGRKDRSLFRALWGFQLCSDHENSVTLDKVLKLSRLQVYLGFSS